jgi:hypothetical protein
MPLAQQAPLAPTTAAAGPLHTPHAFTLPLTQQAPTASSLGRGAVAFAGRQHPSASVSRPRSPQHSPVAEVGPAHCGASSHRAPLYPPAHTHCCTSALQAPCPEQDVVSQKVHSLHSWEAAGRAAPAHAASGRGTRLDPATPAQATRRVLVPPQALVQDDHASTSHAGVYTVDGDADAVGDALVDNDADCDRDADGAGVDVADDPSVAEGVVEGDGGAVVLAVGVTDTLGDPVRDRVTDGLRVRLGVPVLLTVGVVDADEPVEADGVVVADGVALTDAAGETDALAVAVSLGAVKLPASPASSVTFRELTP